MPLIIKKISSFIIRDVKELLSELNYIPLKQKVFIKPNIAVPTWPTSPFITNPDVVAGVIDYLKDSGIDDIIVGEGPVPINFGVEETFDVTGYSHMCRRRNVKLVNLDVLPRKKIMQKDFGVSLPEIAFEREYINISKFKTHYQTTVSLGLKNQKGLLSPEDKNNFHKNLHGNIKKLASVICPSLSIIDGTNALEGNGPVDNGEEVENFNVVIGGTDFLAADHLACRLMGINPLKVEHLKNPVKSEIILGADPDSVSRNFKLPSQYWQKGNLYYWWSDYTCSRCSLIEGKIIEKLEETPLSILSVIPPVALITGPPKSNIPNNITVYGIGKCASLFCRDSGFDYIGGCPPDINEIISRIEAISKVV